MIAVIFELTPKTGRTGDYLTIAQILGEQLKDIEGFISIERFESLAQPGKLLSLSFWKDEQAVQHWRNRAEHRQAQSRGREEVFEDYRLRVASVIRDYGMKQRDQAPKDSISAHNE